MVGYRNISRSGSPAGSILSGVPMVGYRNWMQYFGYGYQILSGVLKMKKAAVRATKSRVRRLYIYSISPRPARNACGRFP